MITTRLYLWLSIVLLVLGAGVRVEASLITFDDISPGQIGTSYLSRGVMFFVGNGVQGNSTGLLMIGGLPVSASAGNFGTSVSAPNIMVPRAGTNEDIFVHFFDPSGLRTEATSVGIFNDRQGQPSRIFIEGFDIDGMSLGRTQIDGAAAGGTFTSPGIYFAKIYGAPGFPDLIGVDDFSYTLGTVPEPTTLTLWSLGALGCVVAGYRRRKVTA